MAKLSKLLFGTALASAAIAGTVAYLKKQENSEATDELKDFVEGSDSTCDDCCSNKDEYKAIASETFEDVRDIVVDTAKNLSSVVKDAYGRVKEVKESECCEDNDFFEDLDEEFQEFDDVLEDAQDESAKDIEHLKDSINDAKDELAKDVEPLKDSIAEVAEDISDAATDSVETLKNATQDKIDEFKSSLSDYTE